MNKLVIGIILVAYSASLSAQKNFSLNNNEKDNNEFHHQYGKDCEEFPRLVDSIYVYDWNRTLNSWVPVTIWQYSISEGKQDRLLFIHADTRKPIRAWDYYYDSRGNRNLELHTSWRNKWVFTQKRESEFSEDNKVMNLLSSFWTNEAWVFNYYYYYEYSGGKMVKAINQLKNPDGSLYDKAYSVYEYDNDKLSEVKSYNSSDGSLTGVNQYFYNEDKLSELLILVPGSDSLNNKIIVPSQRRLYYYDEYSFLREVLFQNWNGTGWDTISKYGYYYKFDKAGKVALCHNGHTICVSVNAVKAHLSHGDKLGECKNEEHPGGKRISEKPKEPPFKIYPNPARERITIRFDNEYNCGSNRVELTDFYGKLIKTFNIKDNSDLTIDRNNLHSGKYYIRLIGNEVYSAVVIFE